MTEIRLSRRAVTRALATLPIIAVPAIGRAGAANGGETTMNMHRALTAARPVQSSAIWKHVVAEYRAARAHWDDVLDVYIAAENACPSFPAPQPERPRCASDGLDLSDMTIREIRELPTDKKAWDEYEAAVKRWDAERDAWDEKHMGEPNRQWEAGYSRIKQAVVNLAACHVSSLPELAEKMALGAAIFLDQGEGDMERDSDGCTTFFKVMAEDLRALVS
jgi:hypothetical protein